MSTPSVTRPSEQIGCVLVSEGKREKRHKRKRKERKQSCGGSCPGPRLLNNNVCAKYRWFSSSAAILFFPISLFPFSLFMFCLALLFLAPTPFSSLKQALNIDRKLSGRHLDLCSQAEVALSLGTEGISSMEGEHGSNKWWRGTISMLEITSTQGLLDHDTSQAVLIIWTAPSAPLIFYPEQFIRSSVCTHTLIHSPLHQKKKKSFLLSPRVYSEVLLHGLQ